MYVYQAAIMPAIVAGKPIPRAVPSVILSDVDRPWGGAVGVGVGVVVDAGSCAEAGVSVGVLVLVLVFVFGMTTNMVVGDCPEVEASQARSAPRSV